MAKKRKSIIRNPKFRDSSSKLIFGDHTLSFQFLRDYGDMEILRKIRPEDVEDVSERYVPLYSTERESDTVKKVNISRYLSPAEYPEVSGYREAKGKKGRPELPLFIVSLVEHKTRVEYNVTMQLLRYAVYIWEDYEREMEKQCPGISAGKGFCYPPILPIVYYEGRDKWTAPMDVSERIFCGGLLGRYLPHFRYQLVRLHDYSNERLLANKDEISLAKVLRTLLYSMNMPESETEDAVAKIKERKMGRLFENVTMDIQAERRKNAEAQEALQAAQREIEAAQQEIEEVQQTAQREIKAAQQEIKAAQRQMEEMQQAARQEVEIYRHISKMLRRDLSEAEIRESLVKNFGLTEAQAADVLRRVLEE